MLKNRRNTIYDDNEECSRDEFPRQIFIWALIMRLLVLGLILLLKDKVSPFIIADDETVDKFSKLYLASATKIVDIGAFSASLIGIGGQASYHSWFWLNAITTFVFKSGNAIRFCNILFSSLSCVFIYLFCVENRLEKKVAMKASRLYAFMPYPVIFSCFQIKDVLFTALVLLLWIVLSRIYRDDRWSLPRIAILVVSGLLVKNIRNGVLEIILIVFFIAYIVKELKEGKRGRCVFFIFMIIVAAVLFGQTVRETFVSKISWYGNYNRVDGSIAAFRIDSITQLYKLPFAYMWSFIQPLMSSSTLHASFWLSTMSILNLSAIPVMFWNVVFFIKGNKTWLYWCTLVLHLASIVLSLGTFRHYFYILPYSYINLALARSETGNGENRLLFMVSYALISIVLLYSLASF